MCYMCIVNCRAGTHLADHYEKAHADRYCRLCGTFFCRYSDAVQHCCPVPRAILHSSSADDSSSSKNDQGTPSPNQFSDSDSNSYCPPAKVSKVAPQVTLLADDIDEAMLNVLTEQIRQREIEVLTLDDSD